MKGVYIHIPFCRQACRYCDFFFTVSLKYQDEFVDHLLMEIDQKAGVWPKGERTSLYLGGGTPSVLSMKNMDRILKAVHKYHSLDRDAEITIECNPDDLDMENLNFFRESGFNRISIGIQSFLDRDLVLMRRSHDAKQAVSSVENAVSSGFENITVDLIYGIPGQSTDEWESNIDQALKLSVNHISAYHLTFETGTVFDHWKKKGRLKPVDEDQSIGQYRILCQKMTEEGFEHYEISSFARDHMRSKHNTLYWSGDPYMGLGPSAHSFDGKKRYWNRASLKAYMKEISRGECMGVSEELTVTERYHDYLITSLRTDKGADLEYIFANFGKKIASHFNKTIQSYLANGTMHIKKGKTVIDPDRWLVADQIVLELFMM